MKLAYEFDPAANQVRICSFHPIRSWLEVRAAQEHPGIPISHGICEVCLARVLEASMEPSKTWLPEQQPKSKEQCKPT